MQATRARDVLLCWRATATGEQSLMTSSYLIRGVALQRLLPLCSLICCAGAPPPREEQSLGDVFVSAIVWLCSVAATVRIDFLHGLSTDRVARGRQGCLLQVQGFVCPQRVGLQQPIWGSESPQLISSDAALRIPNKKRRSKISSFRDRLFYMRR